MKEKNSQIDFAKNILTVKAILLNDENKILLLKRSKKSSNPGKWDLPGGILEKNETLAEALSREIREETGLEIEIGEILGTAEFSKESEQFQDEKRGLRYLAYCDSNEVKISDEHQSFKWVLMEEALEMLSAKEGFENEKREVVQKAKNLLEMKRSLDGWKRALADLENYKKRSVKENEDFKKYCLEDYISSLLPVLDNFELALKHVPEKELKNNWTIGIMHIKKQLENVLTENGVSVIEVKKGDVFNENIHEVIEGEFKKGKVQEILKNGYKIGEKIIRPSFIEIN